MEAIQSYYLYKDSLRRQREDKKKMSQTRQARIRSIAVSWLIEALKTVLGYEDVRNKIVKYVNLHASNGQKICQPERERDIMRPYIMRKPTRPRVLREKCWKT